MPLPKPCKLCNKKIMFPTRHQKICISCKEKRYREGQARYQKSVRRFK